MIDVFQYNVHLGYFVFLYLVLFFYFLFKKNIIGIYDPVFYHLVWVASHISLLVIVVEKDGIDVFGVTFFVLIVFYAVVLKILLPNVNKRSYFLLSRFGGNVFFKESDYFILRLMISLFVVWLSANSSFIVYAFSHHFFEWFSYKYVDLQGRDPISRIAYTGVTPVLWFLALYLILIRKSFKVYSFIVILSFLLVSIMSGGRSSLISFIFIIGAFVFFYYPYIPSGQRKKLAIFAIIGGCLGVAVVVVVNMMRYKSDLDGALSNFLNRVLANGDGLYYYLKYDAFEHIETGFIPFVMSFLGIYLKRFLGVDYKNIGHQLSELATSSELSFAQGANYTIFLQSMVLGVGFSIIYIFMIVYIVSKLRRLHPSCNILRTSLCFSAMLSAFTIVVDLEFAFFRFLSIALVFVFVIIPLYYLILFYDLALKRIYRHP